MYVQFNGPASVLITGIPYLHAGQEVNLPLTSEQKKEISGWDTFHDDEEWQPVIVRLSDGTYCLRTIDEWSQYYYAPIQGARAANPKQLDPLDGTVDLNKLESVVQQEQREWEEQQALRWENRMKDPVPEGCERLRVEEDGRTLGTIVVRVERYGKYNKPYRVTVIEADEGTRYKVGDRLSYFKGHSLPKEGADLEFWGQIPPNPVCPRCGSGANLGYNHDGTHASCWKLVGYDHWNQHPETCWSGSVTELVENEANANPWVKQIRHPGSIK